MEPDKTQILETDSETTRPAPTQAELTPQTEPEAVASMTTVACQDLSEWHGRELVDRDGVRIGKLRDVYFDVETDEPQFGTVREGLFGRHLVLVPLAGATVGPDSMQVAVSKAQIKTAPEVEPEALSAADESRLYHHFQLNYTARDGESGRRLARR